MSPVPPIIQCEQGVTFTVISLGMRMAICLVPHRSSLPRQSPSHFGVHTYLLGKLHPSIQKKFEFWILSCVKTWQDADAGLSLMNLYLLQKRKGQVLPLGVGSGH